MSLLPFDKLSNFMRAIKTAGGIRAALYKMYRMDECKDGVCVGKDKYGNTYWENNRFFYGRNRWVEYAPHYNMDYDGSQIPAEWYGWMHYKTDLIPECDPSRPQYKWMAEHTENLSGTVYQYYPYSTTMPKIEAWNPNKK